MNLLKLSSATLLATAAVAVLPSTAQASEYYNCSNPNGCELVSEKKARNTATQTQYPIIKAHGVLGWTKFFGLIDYFNGIPEILMN